MFDSGPSRPSPPLNRRRAAGIVAAYAVAIAFGLLLFTGNFPGLPGHFSTETELEGHEYYTDWYPIPSPAFGSNSTPPTAVVFHNLTFWVWTTGWDSPQGSYVRGNGTEPNGTAYPFVLGGLPNNANHETLYVSPDSEFAASWIGSAQSFLELLVEV